LQLARGEYNVLFGDKGNGIVFRFSANFGNVLGGARAAPKQRHPKHSSTKHYAKHLRKMIMQKISEK
jgi:hypothetical protein